VLPTPGCLGEELAAGPGEPTADGPVQDVDRPGRVDRAHGLPRRTDRQVLGTVVVEVGVKPRGRGAMTGDLTVRNGRAGW
jgi:hypothetical protein